MLKSLTYAALGLGGAALATALVLLPSGESLPHVASGLAESAGEERVEATSGSIRNEDGDDVAKLTLKTSASTVLFTAEKSATTANYFVVTSTDTNFYVDVVSPDAPAYFGVMDKAKPAAFQLNVTNMTNAVSCRVAIDPQEGYDRKSAIKLSVEKQGETNWVEVVSNITEFAITTNMYSFTNGVYRFNVTGATSNDAYVVTLGASGVQIDFEPFVRARESYNWTTNSPYGYLPTLTTSAECGQFLGWYDSPVATTSNKIEKTEIATTNAMAWARWSKYPYWVAFDKGTNTAEGAMTPQPFYHDKPDYLKRNEYYLLEHRFEGWTTNGCTNVVYRDCALVTNLCDTAGGTNTLYAVWSPTPGTNWYVVAAGVTNFSKVAVSSDKPTFFAGTSGEANVFTMTTVGEAKCRVSIDPESGDRTGAKLTIARASYAVLTNGTEQIGAWTNVCEVSDLAVEEVKYTFTTNWIYRFNVAASTNYNYKIGLGAAGVQYTFEPCGGEVKPGALSDSLVFNWTVDSPVGYLPPLTNSAEFGTNTWHYTPEVDKTNYVYKTDLVTNVATTCYAHWSQGIIVPIVFDQNLINYGASTNIVTTNYYGQGTKIVLYGSGRTKGVPDPKYEDWGFLGWTTNATTTAGYAIESFTIPTNSVPTNTLAFYAQWTKEWLTSRTGGGLSIDGCNGTVGAALSIPNRISTATGIEWPVNVVAIGDSAFPNGTFSVLSLPTTLTSIGSSAFMGCSALGKLEIPAGVTFVGDSAFEDCTSLASVTFPTTPVENEYATEGFLSGILGGEDPIELGEAAFRGCKRLTNVELPLGLMILPNYVFSGCTSLAEFAMPYTVVQIGEEAFASCTHLQTVEVTEVVDEIQTLAFQKCARLKLVKFIGNQPDAASGDIFKGTQRNTLVGYLENMRESVATYCGGNWPELPSTWPSGDYARTLTWLGDGQYPRRKVVFNLNDGDAPATSTVTPVLYHLNREFGLLAPTAEEMEEKGLANFSGWWTKPIGGRKIGNYRKVTENMTVYAHWNGEEETGGAEIGSRSSEDYPVVWPGGEGSEYSFEEFTGFYSADDDMFYYAACTFNGIIVDTSADNHAITGTVVFAFQDGKYSDGELQSPFTATVTWNSGKVTTITGVADVEGNIVAQNSRWSFGTADDAEEDRTLITKSGIYGWLTDKTSEARFRVYAARNRYAMSNEASKSIVLTGLQATKGTWHVVLKSSAGESEFSNGYSTLAITVSGMGQASIVGTLADGTAVSTSSTLIIGDGCCCLPVSIRPYGGKGSVAFMLWFAWQADGSFSEEEDDVSVQGLSEWTAPTFTVPFDEIYPLTFIDEKRYSGDASFDCDRIATVRITAYDNGTKWKIAEGEENPDRLKVSYSAATGLFTGSFAVENSETGKQSTATVNGAFTDTITADGDFYHGYGTAVIKDEGSVPVEITTDKAE